MDRNLKILLLGDYSNCHANLATGLRKVGCRVTMMSPRNYLSADKIDINTARKDGKIGGLLLFLKALTIWRKYLKGYDVVSINDPIFLHLKPERLKPLFNFLKEENDLVFYTAMSNDVNYLRMCKDPSIPLKKNEFFIDGKPSPWNLEDPKRWEGWQVPSLVSYQDYVFDNLDGALSVLYEYHVGLRHRFEENKIGYIGIPIDTSEIPFIGPGNSKKIRILLGRDRKRIKMKGSDLLEEAAIHLARKYPYQIELKIAENLPYYTFVDELKKSDIILDQVYSYTPATTALLAMAMGKTVVTGGEPEYYEFIGEKENHPIINASMNVTDLINSLENVIFDKNFLNENANKARNFVEKHNDHKIVAQRYLNFREQIISSRS